jgi:hypothetical protein
MSPLGRAISEYAESQFWGERRVDMKNKALLWLAAFVIGSALAFPPVIIAAEKKEETKKEEKKEEKAKKSTKAKKGEEKKEDKKAEKKS